MFGQREIGFVDPMTIGNDPERPANLILAGRYWRVVSTDWRSRLVYVEQTENRGKASWLGSSRALRFTLCQTIKKILIDQVVPAELSSRASTRLKNLTESFPVLEEEKTTAERVVRNNKAEWTWWTFGGGAANFLLADSAGMEGSIVRSYDNFRVSLTEVPRKAGIAPAGKFSVSGNKFIRQLGRQLKFHQCLPDNKLDEVMAERICDYQGAESIVNTGIAIVQ